MAFLLEGMSSAVTAAAMESLPRPLGHAEYTGVQTDQTDRRTVVAMYISIK